MFFDVDNVLGTELLSWNMEHGNYSGIWVIEINYETQFSIEFLPPNNGSKKCLKKSLHAMQECCIQFTVNFWIADTYGS